MNPIGNTGFMSAPPPSYTDYFNSLKSTPKKEFIYLMVLMWTSAKLIILNYLPNGFVLYLKKLK